MSCISSVANFRIQPPLGVAGYRVPYVPWPRTARLLRFALLAPRFIARHADQTLEASTDVLLLVKTDYNLRWDLSDRLNCMSFQTGLFKRSAEWIVTEVKLNDYSILFSISSANVSREPCKEGFRSP